MNCTLCSAPIPAAADQYGLIHAPVCLSCWYAAPRPCPMCGNGWFTCNTCDGAGDLYSFPCDDCGSSGHVPCDYCNGSNALDAIRLGRLDLDQLGWLVQTLAQEPTADSLRPSIFQMPLFVEAVR